MTAPQYNLAQLVRAANDQEEEEEIDEEENRTQMIAALVIAGAEFGQQCRNETRHSSRLYLCCSELLPNPRTQTPWQILYKSQNDRAFITTMGFDVVTFDYILSSGFAESWNQTPIPRDNTNIAGIPRLDRRSLDAPGALGLVLHYLNSTMREVSLQQIFAIILTTVSHYLAFGLKILLSTLKILPEARIEWPKLANFEDLSNLVVHRHARLTGAFGSIDGLKLPVQTSSDLDIENATFNGWLSEHFISSVITFSSKGGVIAARTNAPGSWHDSRVAQPIYHCLRTQTPEGYFLVADTAFPHGTLDIDHRIRSPLKDGQRVRGTADVIAEALAFNCELLAYRQTAEWGMHAIQGSFGRLHMPLNCDDDKGRGDLIEICLWLHNLRTIKVGINQIRTVYLRYWQQTDEDKEVWTRFAEMMFSEQRTKDRVARFHVAFEYE